MDQDNRCPQCGAEMPADVPHGLCPACLLKRGLETQAVGGEGSQPASAFVPPTPAELAPCFPDLEILELLGQGGMGVVYKARQKRLNRLVALKILSPRIAQDTAFAERFAREARAMAMLGHPQIVAVHDFGQASGMYYFLMEFVDGVNLRQLLDAKKLSPPEALAIVPQICDALQFAHNAGVVHRDIKPENILLDKRGRVKIADFGLAKLTGQEALNPALTGIGQVMGTPHYMAPEQLEHPQEVDHGADIYSLGVVFYQMLTGELPLGRFARPSARVLLDVRLDDVVLRALEKEPELRYQQASDVKTEVETIAATAGPVRSALDRPPPNGTHVAFAWIALGLVLAGLLGGEAICTVTLEAGLIFGALCECLALVLGIFGRRHTAGKVAVIGGAFFSSLVFLWFLLPSHLKAPFIRDVPLETTRPSDLEPNNQLPPLDRASFNSDRKVAEWVLSIGGVVKIDDNGWIREIKAVSDLPSGAFKLTLVYLGNNQKLTDAELANFKDCQNLMWLDLSETNVSYAGLAHLKECKKLGALVLERTEVGDLGLAALKDCRNLMELYLQETKVTAAGIGELKKALPRCEIEWDRGAIEP